MIERNQVNDHLPKVNDESLRSLRCSVLVDYVTVSRQLSSFISSCLAKTGVSLLSYSDMIVAIAAAAGEAKAMLSPTIFPAAADIDQGGVSRVLLPPPITTSGVAIQQ